MKKCLFFILLMRCTLLSAQEAKNEPGSIKKTVRDSYDSLISKATRSISHEEFEQARDYYVHAQLLLPKDPYAAKMIYFVDRSIWANNEKRVREQELARKAEISTLMKTALHSILVKNYDSARILYQRVLTLNPVTSQAEFAKKKIKALDAVLGISPLTSDSTASGIKETMAKEKTVVPKLIAPDMQKTEVTGLSQIRSNNIKQNDRGSILSQSANKETPQINYQDSGHLKPKAQNEVASGKIKNNLKVPKSVSMKTGMEDRATVDSKKEVPVKAKEKSIALPQTKSVKASSSLQEQGDKIKEQTNVDVLMDQAAKAINLKNYKEARGLYQKVVSSNAPKGKKDFAKMVIIAIDEVVEKEGKKKL